MQYGLCDPDDQGIPFPRLISDHYRLNGDECFIGCFFQAEDLRRTFGLSFVTSSIEEKAEAKANDPPLLLMVLLLLLCFTPSRAKELVSLGQEKRKEGDELDSRIEQMEGKSEVATYMAASTMTAVIMAGEKEKHEAAAAASPFEWFICDDLSTYTGYFVIKVGISPLP